MEGNNVLLDIFAPWKKKGLRMKQSITQVVYVKPAKNHITNTQWNPFCIINDTSSLFSEDRLPWISTIETTKLAWSKFVLKWSGKIQIILFVHYYLSQLVIIECLYWIPLLNGFPDEKNNIYNSQLIHRDLFFAFKQCF